MKSSIFSIGCFDRFSCLSKKDDGVQAAGPGVASGLKWSRFGLLPNGTVHLQVKPRPLDAFGATSSFDSYYKADDISAYQLGGDYQDFLKRPWAFVIVKLILAGLLDAALGSWI